ncbi:MAG TPA: endolytic transglycosylase MltG [Candidatus Acidoferrales bacterium]|nr:endolytic transglycosylase MltG [Candidatus Acidoferrales bacterium]
MRRLATLVLLALFALAGAAAWVAYQWRTPYRGYAGAAVVDIPRGESTRAIAGLLASAGVVPSALGFQLYCRWRRRQPLEAGEYRFDRPMTPPEVFDMLAQGRIWTVTVTVPEGWTMLDIAAEVAREGLAGREAFLRSARDPSPVRDLAPRAPTLEGFLFPAVYRFPHRTTPRAITAAMVERFREAWTRVAGPDVPPRGLTVEQVVTLASLVEEETPKPAERPVVAAVFLNRLELGYPLECDPSVVYALKLAGRYNGALEPAELHVASAYNTYLHRGLPPGPIGNPGEASLRAALEPAHSDFLYFVADGSGGHAFSRTLAQHERNVMRYRRLLAGTTRHRGQARDRARPPHAAAGSHSTGSSR